MTNIVNFDDTFDSENPPVQGNLIASNLKTYVDDAAYEAAELGSPVLGNAYVNSTLNLIRYYNGTEWVSVADEASVQEFTNKTIDADQNTITNITDDEIANGAAIDATKIHDGTVDNDEFGRLDGVTSNIQAQLDTKLADPTTTKGDLIARNSTELNRLPVGTDGQVLTADAAEALGVKWSDPTGGTGTGNGVFNYITQGDGEEVDQWVSYSNTTPSNFPDNFGGVASGNVTITSNATDPLLDSSDLQINKDAADRQGEGVYFPFTIRNGDLTSIQRLMSNYKTSTDFADEDITFSVVTTNDNWVSDFKTLRFTPEGLPATELPNRLHSETQFGPLDTDARFCIHIASTNASAYNVNMELELGPRAITHGAIVTDPVPFDMIIENASFGTNTQEAYWNRNGKYMELRWDYDQTAAGSDFGGNYELVISNTGFEPDVNFVKTNSGNGLGIVGKATSPGYSAGSVMLQGNGKLVVQLVSPTVQGYWGPSVNPMTNASSDMSITARIPIKGWSGTGVISEDLGSRQIALIAHSNGNQPVTSSVTDLTYSVSEEDTTASWNGTQFTVPETGFYDVKATVRSAAASYSIFVYKNGSNYARMHTGYGSASANAGGSALVYAVKGETISIRINTSTTLSDSSDETDHRLSIYKVQTPQSLRGSETVCAFYKTSAGQSIPHNTQTAVIFGDLVKDTHNKMNTSTGVYKVPYSGQYQINTNTRWDTSANLNRTFITISVNGVDVVRGIDESTVSTLQASALLDVVKDDEITIRVYQDHSLTVARNLQSFSDVNYVTINKI